ncbi:hypothetical protein ACLB2K_013586 [Fragaria x ananassa]
MASMNANKNTMQEPQAPNKGNPSSKKQKSTGESSGSGSQKLEGEASGEDDEIGDETIEPKKIISGDCGEDPKGGEIEMGSSSFVHEVFCTEW